MHCFFSVHTGVCYLSTFCSSTGRRWAERIKLGLLGKPPQPLDQARQGHIALGLSYPIIRLCIEEAADIRALSRQNLREKKSKLRRNILHVLSFFFIQILLIYFYCLTIGALFSSQCGKFLRIKIESVRVLFE